MARRKGRQAPGSRLPARRGRLTVFPEAGDRWVAELVDEGEVRTFRGPREDVLVWGLIEMPLEAVLQDPVRGERSFGDWVREVKAEVGPTRPDGADVPGAVVAEMYAGGEPAVGVGERGRRVSTEPLSVVNRGDDDLGAEDQTVR